MKKHLIVLVLSLFVDLQLNAQDLTENYRKLILNSPNDVSLFQSNSTNGIWASGTIASDRWGVFEDATTSKERLTILSGGNVGIGTKTPTSRMHVVHTSGEGSAPTISGNIATFQTNGSSGYFASINVIGGTAGKSSLYFGDKDSGAMGGLRYNNANNSLSFRTNGSDDRLFIDTNGNIGIGNDTPDAHLQVGESTNGLILMGNNRANAGSAIGTTRSDGGLILGYNIYANYQDSNDNYMARVSKSHSKGFAGMKFSQYGVIDFYGYGSGVTADDFANASGNIKMRIQSDGNIGIGTTDTKGFKLGVQGKIAAEEVKVATYANWADFVFKSDYKLPTLEEVEQHIKENGHLKDIPTAEEVKKDGFYLGEMDSKLLQKIEELTLYTIEQQKGIEAQNNKIESQSGKIEKLEKENKELQSLSKRLSDIEKLLNNKIRN